MKQVLLVSMLSAVLSSLLTVVVMRSVSPPAPAAPAIPSDLRVSVPELERVLVDIRRVLAERSAAPGADGRPGSVVESPQRAPDEHPATGAYAERSSAPSSSFGGRLEDLIEADREGGFVTHRDARARLILRSEEQISAWFGAPHEIEVLQSGAENWTYRIPTGVTNEDGSADAYPVVIRIHRGRVVAVE